MVRVSDGMACVTMNVTCVMGLTPSQVSCVWDHCFLYSCQMLVTTFKGIFTSLPIGNLYRNIITPQQETFKHRKYFALGKKCSYWLLRTDNRRKIKTNYYLTNCVFKLLMAIMIHFVHGVSASLLHVMLQVMLHMFTCAACGAAGTWGGPRRGCATCPGSLGARESGPGHSSNINIRVIIF